MGFCRPYSWPATVIGPETGDQDPNRFTGKLVMNLVFTVTIAGAELNGEHLVIRLDGLTKAYKHGPRAVDRVSLEIRARERVARLHAGLAGIRVQVFEHAGRDQRGTQRLGGSTRRGHRSTSTWVARAATRSIRAAGAEITLP